MTDEDKLFIPEPVKLETITNTKEINSNIDKIQNPFQNLKKAREELKVNPNSIVNVLAGRTKHAGGYSWKEL